MTRAWDKEKFWVPDGNRTDGLPDTGWALKPTELRETRCELGHLLGWYVTPQAAQANDKSHSILRLNL